MHRQIPSMEWTVLVCRFRSLRCRKDRSQLGHPKGRAGSSDVGEKPEDDAGVGTIDDAGVAASEDNGVITVDDAGVAASDDNGVVTVDDAGLATVGWLGLSPSCGGPPGLVDAVRP